MFDAGKTRMIGLPYGEKNYDDMLSRFRLIPERYGPPISISRVSMRQYQPTSRHNHTAVLHHKTVARTGVPSLSV